MLTIKIENQEIEQEFQDLVDVFGTEDEALEEVFRFMKVYYAVFFRKSSAPGQENSFHALLAELRQRVQTSGRFSGMSHADLLASLKKTREEVWEEEYQASYAHIL